MAKHSCIVCGAPGEACGQCPSEPTFCPSHLGEHRAAVHADARGGSSRSVDDALAALLLEEGFEPE